MLSRCEPIGSGSAQFSHMSSSSTRTGIAPGTGPFGLNSLIRTISPMSPSWKRMSRARAIGPVVKAT